MLGTRIPSEVWFGFSSENCRRIAKIPFGLMHFDGLGQMRASLGSSFRGTSSLQMHVEAARMLQFAEEEFVKALDWGQ